MCASPRTTRARRRRLRCLTGLRQMLKRLLEWPPAGSEVAMLRAALHESGETFVAHPRRAVVWGSVLLVAVALGGVFVPAGPLAVDARWSELMRDIETPFLTHIALIFNALGHGILSALALAAIGLFLLLARRWAAAIAFVVVEALTPLLVNVIKLPSAGRAHPASWSRPTAPRSPRAMPRTQVRPRLQWSCSSPRSGRRRTYWYAIGALATAGMVWSRTYLQVHWLFDALCGALLGVAVAFLSFGVVQIALSGRVGVDRVD